MRYRVNGPEVISETVGGETIIVNLASGHYFNLQGTAVDVWEGLARGDSTDVIVARLRANYEASEGEIENAVETLLAELVATDLVAPSEDGDGPSVPVAAASSTNGEVRPPFTTPTVTTFTDMQDIILLDPVHEVDSRGWPHAPAGA